MEVDLEVGSNYFKYGANEGAYHQICEYFPKQTFEF